MLFLKRRVGQIIYVQQISRTKEALGKPSKKKKCKLITNWPQSRINPVKVGFIGLKVRTNESPNTTNLGVPWLFLIKRVGQIT